MAMCGLLVFILLVIATFYGGYSQRLDGPFCHHDADGNVIWCEKSRRSLNKDTSSGIAHGEAADILEHPYTLALEIDETFQCGASIIGSKWALTAAHCFPNVTVDRVQLRALSNERERGGITFGVSDIELHPEYHYNKYEHDIALLHVAESFLESDTRLAAINLPQQDEELPVGTMVTVLGWGRTENGGKSDHLRIIEIPIVSFELCDQYVRPNSDWMICAGAEGRKIPCLGDSGGPVVFENTLYAIVFVGKGCGLPGVPGMFTKVAAYREWIEEMTGI